MTEVGEQGAAARPERAPGRRRRRLSFGAGRLVLVLVLIGLCLGLAGMALTGRSLALPVWAVAGIEGRLNRSLAGSHLPPGAGLALGGVAVALDPDFTPRFRLSDLRLIDGGGRSVLALPELDLAIDPGALLTGRLHLSSVRLVGAHLEAERDAEGRIGLSIGGISGSRTPQSLAGVLDALDRMFSSPGLEKLALVEADALTLTLTDRRGGRTWHLGDGRLVLENRDEGLAADLGITLLDGERPARAQLTIQTDKASSAARILARLDGMASGDLAAQAPPLAFLGLVEAPISGRLLGDLDESGAIRGFEATLGLGAGAIRPEPTAAPVPFEKAEIALRYDPLRQRVTLGSLRLESASLRLRARGSADLQDGAGGPALPGRIPAVVVGQLAFSEIMVDPDGVFAEPVRFDTGALAVRVTLDPFRAEIGEFSMGAGEEQLRLRGEVSVDPQGWRGALDVALGRIDADRLMKLWPVSVVPGTRAWLAANLGQGQFLDLDAGLRFAPGEAPHFALDYDFAEAEVRFIRTLPPVRDGFGRSAIAGNSYVIVLEGGHVTAPNGGVIDAAGSVLRVPDITRMPADAEVTLHTRSDLTAALSLLDQEPFRFLSKAGRPVDLGAGEARLVSDLRFPLKNRIGVEDVAYSVAGRVRGFRSEVLVPGRVLEVPDMAVTVTPEGLELAGQGRLDRLAFDAQFRQPFGPEAGGRASLSAKVALSDAALRGFGIALPEGWLKGETPAAVEMDLPKGEPARLRLDSGLAGARLSIPPLGWSKGPGAKGRLELSATLGDRPRIDALTLTAPGLEAAGKLTTTAAGALEALDLSRLRVGDWLDAPMVLRGEGKGRGVAVEITGGTLDMRRMPGGDGGGSGSTRMEVALDRLVVSQGIALTGLRGAFVARAGGLDGRFDAEVNGRGRIAGAVVPDRGRTAVRITAKDAGRVMAAAGIFEKGRGGTLDMTLSPRGPEGQYVGTAAFSDLSVQDAPFLAALLSAVSVVGLLEQMARGGLVFDSGDAEFVLTPAGVQITRGVAVGVSLGITFEGAYSSASGKLDLQGVISPIYLLNGLGQIFGRKGEGLFGFTYRMSGPAASPSVSVNPLSILTPGMFREIFRRPPPRIEGKG